MSIVISTVTLETQINQWILVYNKYVNNKHTRIKSNSILGISAICLFSSLFHSWFFPLKGQEIWIIPLCHHTYLCSCMKGIPHYISIYCSLKFTKHANGDLIVLWKSTVTFEFDRTLQIAYLYMFYGQQLPIFLVRSVLLIVLIFLCCLIMCHYVLISVLWCPLRFPHKNDVRFIFT